jgi:hypothetical protein
MSLIRRITSSSCWILCDTMISGLIECCGLHCVIAFTALPARISAFEIGLKGAFNECGCAGEILRATSITWAEGRTPSAISPSCPSPGGIRKDPFIMSDDTISDNTTSNEIRRPAPTRIEADGNRNHSQKYTPQRTTGNEASSDPCSTMNNVTQRTTSIAQSITTQSPNPYCRGS